MAAYKEYLTQQILKIIKNSDIIDPTYKPLITKIEDLNNINYTFYIFINHLINYYHKYIDIFKVPKAKTIGTLNNLLNNIIYQSNFHSDYFDKFNKYKSAMPCNFIVYLANQGLSIDLPMYRQTSVNKYLEFYSLTFNSIIITPTNLKQNLDNFNIFFKYDSLFKGLKFYILYRYLLDLYYCREYDTVNIPKYYYCFRFFFR